MRSRASTSTSRNAIAADLGAKPKYIEALSDNRIAFLKDGTADLILSTMTINAERDEEIDFSEPYFIARGRILVKKSDNSIKGIDDLAGKKVCTALGSTYEETLKKQAPKAKIDPRRRLLGVPRGDPERLGRRGLHRRRDPHRHDHPGRLAQARRRRGADHRALRRRHQGGRHGVPGVRQRSIKKFKDDGRWAKSYEKWVGQYTGEEQEPPTMTLQEAIDLRSELVR